MNRSTLFFLALLLNFSFLACRQSPAPPPTTDQEVEEKRLLPPEDRYGELYLDVQKARVFPDGKTFADAIPKKSTQAIIDAYKNEKTKEDFDLERFVMEHFDMPIAYSSNFKSDLSLSAAEHIETLWPVLTRQPDAVDPGTLISLPFRYIVPGGRFGEIYYWDSYFTMLGLIQSDSIDMVESMINNFSYLIDTIGFIPNGNRTYFLTRSQPPFYAAMIELLADAKSDSVYLDYLPQLEKEYGFWMNGLGDLSPENPTVEHLVRMPDGIVLNRYFDKGTTPRGEMIADDLHTAEAANRDPKEVYSDIRAACESGWDFSSRWFEDAENLHTIRTTKIVPVDLNSLLYNLEQVLAKAYRLAGDESTASLFEQRAAQRLEGVQKYCWDEEAGFFKDYDFEKQTFTPVPSLAGSFPLFFGLATQEQAEASAEFIEQNLLKGGGVVSTMNETGEQWDAPNGWAPLQWVTIAGLRNYNQTELAEIIKQRWVELNVRVYKQTGKMVEKYNVVDPTVEGGGGEYPVQDGFGWTNGVLLKLLSESEE